MGISPSQPPPPADTPGTLPGAALEVHIAQTGEDLLRTLSGVLDSLSASPPGPQSLSRRLGIDKVLASRLLKAVRSTDPMSVVNRAPGPEPLRRVLKAAQKQGVDAAILKEAAQAVDRFERLIRDEVGDRSSLDAILSAWVPEARKEFELRRKQAAFKAMSQLKGAHAESLLATVFLAPAAGGERLDVVWVNGLFGLQRLRPGAAIKFATRRMAPASDNRRPRTLAGSELEDEPGLLLPEFCSSPTPRLRAHRVGEIVHYSLGDEGFGPSSAVDLVFSEVNLGEIPRLPTDPRRRPYVFAEISTPSKLLQFDALVHESVYRGASPQLRIYDTAFEGVADINDATRDIDRLDMLERIEEMPQGVSSCRSPDVPRYSDLLRTVCERMGWDGSEFRGYRCRIDYPIYGSQAAMAFAPRHE